MKTLKKWAEENNIIPNTAYAARQRVRVGEKLGGMWILSDKDFEILLKKINSKNLRKIKGINYNDIDAMLKSGMDVNGVAKYYNVSRQTINYHIKKGEQK
jgi:DNA invertase Pin-like site-specific DNA recombinase